MIIAITRYQYVNEVKPYTACPSLHTLVRKGVRPKDTSAGASQQGGAGRESPLLRVRWGFEGL